MFNIESIAEIAGTSSMNANLTELTTEHCASLLIAETLVDMARPIRKLSTNPRVAIQQQFNRSIALLVKGADGSTKDSLQEIAQQAALRIQSSRQLGDDDAINEAVERMERVVKLFADVASSVCRNGYYRHDECTRQEGAVADANPTAGATIPDGANHAGVGMAFETRSDYAGWSAVRVESDVMKEAVEDAIAGLVSVVKALLPMTSAYYQGMYRNDKQEVVVQLGYQRNEDGEYDNFYSLQDTWNSIAANRREVVAPMTAEDAVAAFKL